MIQIFQAYIKKTLMLFLQFFTKTTLLNHIIRVRGSSQQTRQRKTMQGTHLMAFQWLTSHHPTLHCNACFRLYSCLLSTSLSFFPKQPGHCYHTAITVQTMSWKVRKNHKTHQYSTGRVQQQSISPLLFN